MLQHLGIGGSKERALGLRCETELGNRHAGPNARYGGQKGNSTRGQEATPVAKGFIRWHSMTPWIIFGKRFGSASKEKY
jgi:hypothetical protein